MPLMDALILTAICIAFVGFALLLAWGDYKTRNLKTQVTYSRSTGLISKFDMSCPRLCLLGSLIAAALPALAADADNGERLAQRWCVACHIVTTVQTGTTTDQAPPFPSIAKKPDFDAAKIALFLLDPHPKMPDMGLSRKEAADLAAYIATLK